MTLSTRGGGASGSQEEEPAGSLVGVDAKAREKWQITHRGVPAWGRGWSHTIDAAATEAPSPFVQQSSILYDVHVTSRPSAASYVGFKNTPGLCCTEASRRCWPPAAKSEARGPIEGSAGAAGAEGRAELSRAEPSRELPADDPAEPGGGRRYPSLPGLSSGGPLHIICRVQIRKPGTAGTVGTALSLWLWLCRAGRPLIKPPRPAPP